jgi:transposase
MFGLRDWRGSVMLLSSWQGGNDMHIKVREPGDRDRLKGCIGPERDAEQRDRYRAALLAIDGQPTKAVMTMLSRSRGFVQRWAYAYRDGGIDAIMVQPCGGSEPKLDAPMQAKFITRFKAGPTDADGGQADRIRRVLPLRRGQPGQRPILRDARADRQYGLHECAPGVHQPTTRL